MIIAEVLQKKGDNVTSVTPSTPITKVISVLAAQKIGAVIVREGDGVPLGIFSERDVIRILDAQGAGVLDQAVATAMTPDPITCSKQDQVQAVLAVMSARHFRHMPVLENGKVCGMVSIRDLVEERLGNVETEAEALRAYVSGS